MGQALDGATADLADLAGRSIDELDPAGSLRTALSALAGVAALRPGFDVIVALPAASFALRVQNVDDEVEIEILQRDGPDGAAEPGAQPAEPDAQPADPEPTAEGPADRAPGDPAGPSIPSQSAPPEPAPSPDPPGGHVASDLAAMLWQNIGEPSS
jgi:hypothetical protein